MRSVFKDLASHGIGNNNNNNKNLLKVCSVLGGKKTQLKKRKVSGQDQRRKSLSKDLA